MPDSERRVRRKLASSLNDANLAVADDSTTAANQLSGNVLAIIFGFLPLKDVMRSRRVCSDWKEAAKGTVITSEFEVRTVQNFRSMELIAIPNLQHLSLYELTEDVSMLPMWSRRGKKGGDRYVAGDNPDESLAGTANWATTHHDIGIISNFQNLLSLSIIGSPLNGEYPVLFSFPLLQRLTISDDLWEYYYIKWDLKMLEGLPMLRELVCCTNEAMSGNLSSLKVLKDTLETIDITGCRNVVGNFMDLADFPRLRKLDLRSTSVAGDIRDICASDFIVLQELFLPQTVYGGSRYAFQTIAEVPEFISRIRVLANRFSLSTAWRLSCESPDWYVDPNIGDTKSLDADHRIPPPFVFELVTLGGTRLGWRWRCNFPSQDRWYFCDNGDPHDPHDPDDYEDSYPSYVFESCEINWLEPEPDRGSIEYEEYKLQFRSLEEEIHFYRGYHNPPTEDEYNRLRNEQIAEHADNDDFAYYDPDVDDY